MAGHPEVPDALNQQMKALTDMCDDIERTPLGLVWCHGCGAQRAVNAAYLPYLKNGIQSCRFCRGD